MLRNFSPYDPTHAKHLHNSIFILRMRPPPEPQFFYNTPPNNLQSQIIHKRIPDGFCQCNGFRPQHHVRL